MSVLSVFVGRSGTLIHLAYGEKRLLALVHTEQKWGKDLLRNSFANNSEEMASNIEFKCEMLT